MALAPDAEQQIARDSAAFSQTLNNTLLASRHQGVNEDTKRYAIDRLNRISALMDDSHLYSPSVSPSGFGVGMGSVPEINDYLLQQLQRAQILLGYAQPFVTYLQNIPAVTQQTNTQQAVAFWNNSIRELNSYIQLKNPNNQISLLEKLIFEASSNGDDARCAVGKPLAPPAGYGNDLFSERRHNLEKELAFRFDQRCMAELHSVYRQIARRFDQELSGRYPFADLTAQDAPPTVVKAFFVDYAAQQVELNALLENLGENRADIKDIRRFFEQLDLIADFFSGNLTAGERSTGIKLDVGFRALTKQSLGTNQIITMRLGTEDSVAAYPNQNTSLNWMFGQALVLDLVWADLSNWQPTADSQQPTLLINESTASFTAEGDWALLRLIGEHKPASAPARDPLDPSKLYLEFVVPLQGAQSAKGVARIYLALSFNVVTSSSQALRKLSTLPTFPQRSPINY